MRSPRRSSAARARREAWAGSRAPSSGALIIQVISNGLDMVNVPSYYQQIVKGTIIVFAVYVDIRSKKKA